VQADLGTYYKVDLKPRIAMLHETIGFGESTEMYLKSIHELMDKAQVVPISMLAEHLGITVVSVTEMVHRMQDQNFVEHVPYKGVTLTDQGRHSARAILRRQRLWECFLYEKLGLPWERVYDLACKLEHAAGAEVTEALAKNLDEPACCPHGNPIPTAHGELTISGERPLRDLRVGEQAVLRRVEPAGSLSTVYLAYLAQHGLTPGMSVTLEALEPVDELRTLKTGVGTVIVGRQLAAQIYVEARADE
jgi:DtxR family Mn-dependent transcriptional regulator